MIFSIKKYNIIRFQNQLPLNRRPVGLGKRALVRGGSRPILLPNSNHNQMKTLNN